MGMSKFVYRLTSTINIVGIVMFIALGVVSIVHPAGVWDKLESLTSAMFYLFFSYWLISLILRAQSKMDKDRRDTKNMEELGKVINKE